MVKSLFYRRLLLVTPISYLLVLLLASLPLTASQTYMNLTRGFVTSLSSSGPNSYLTSPSGDFAFGFWAYNSSDSLFLLAIWFNAASSKHIIWYAMAGENPILAPKSSTFGVNQDEMVVLLSSDNSQLWSSGNYQTREAILLDSGNFVICKNVCDSTNPPLWENFQNPTDTLVPGQNLSSGQQLWSKLTDSNFSQGRFNLLVQGGNYKIVIYPANALVSTRNHYPSIWDTGESKCEHLVFNSEGSLMCSNNSWKNIISSPTLSPLHYYQQLHAVYIHAHN